MAKPNKDKSTPADPQGPQDRKVDTAPQIDHALQLKWGLALLGEDRAREYLLWLRDKLDRHPRQHS